MNYNLPKKAVKNMKSVPSIRLSGSPSPSVSIANIVKGCCGALTPPG